MEKVQSGSFYACSGVTKDLLALSELRECPVQQLSWLSFKITFAFVSTKDYSCEPFAAS